MIQDQENSRIVAIMPSVGDTKSGVAIRRDEVASIAARQVISAGIVLMEPSYASIVNRRAIRRPILREY